MNTNNPLPVTVCQPSTNSPPSPRFSPTETSSGTIVNKCKNVQSSTIHHIHLKCPPGVEWINCDFFIKSATRIKALMLYAMADLTNRMLNESSQTQKSRYCVIPFI